MLDGGALPAWFSRSAAALTEAGWLAGTVTVGQAFGGDVEAVSLHSGLLAARHVLGAELAVVAQGPGNLGTGTRWGFSGVAAGEAVNAAAVLGGRPVGSLRISAADQRRAPSRHLPSQPDLLRPGRTGQGRHRGTGAAGRIRRTGAGRGAAAGRPAQPGAGQRCRAGRDPARLPGPAVHHGPRPGRGPGLLPGRRRRGPARSGTRRRAWLRPGALLRAGGAARPGRPDPAVPRGAGVAAGRSTGGSCPAAGSSPARATSRPLSARDPRGDRPDDQRRPRSARRAGGGRRPGRHAGSGGSSTKWSSRSSSTPTRPPITDGGRTAEELEEYVGPAGGTSPTCLPAPSASTLAGCPSCCPRSWPAPT